MPVAYIVNLLILLFMHLSVTLLLKFNSVVINILYQHCNLVVLFVLLAIKGIRFQRKQARLSEHSLDEQIKILDTLGDLYCQVKAFHKALSCYKKEVF